MVDNTAAAPPALRLNDILAKLNDSSLAANQRCVNCHSSTSINAALPPVFYDNIGRDGDGDMDATDKSWLYKEVRGRINFTDIEASSLLRKPAGKHHNGSLRPGFDTSKPPGDPDRRNYDLFVNWILNGAPE